ncbi:hypothetical protein H8356DRAFT_518136 [Neocallimastix lanati (nom. inval.)]|nr:hypothetical protein H8356DRAFT_518136 [Neocallimastix sp. JGI-2020a]
MIISLVIYYAPLFGLNKSRCSKAQKIINRGLYWSYGFKSRNSSVSLYDITRELRIPPLSLSVLYLNYDALENGKILHVLLIISLIIFLLCHIYSWTKESRTLDKKLNGKKTSEIKKVLLGKRCLQILKSQKKQLFTRRMILDLFQKSET